MRGLRPSRFSMAIFGEGLTCVKCPCEAVISASTVQSLQMASLAAETTGGQILIAFLPKHDLRSNLRVPNFPGGACPQTPLASSHLCKAVDKWVLGCVKAPPIFWHLYLKDIVHSHSTQLLIMCNESQHSLVSQNKNKNLSTALLCIPSSTVPV